MQIANCFGLVSLVSLGRDYRLSDNLAELLAVVRSRSRPAADQLAGDMIRQAFARQGIDDLSDPCRKVVQAISEGCRIHEPNPNWSLWRINTGSNLQFAITNLQSPIGPLIPRLSAGQTARPAYPSGPGPLKLR
jgi:hypothetical protein